MVNKLMGSSRKVSAMNFEAFKLPRPQSGFCTVVNFLLRSGKSEDRPVRRDPADSDLSCPNRQFSSAAPGNRMELSVFRNRQRGRRLDLFHGKTRRDVLQRNRRNQALVEGVIAGDIGDSDA